MQHLLNNKPVLMKNHQTFHFHIVMEHKGCHYRLNRIYNEAFSRGRVAVKLWKKKVQSTFTAFSNLNLSTVLKKEMKYWNVDAFKLLFTLVILNEMIS